MKEQWKNEGWSNWKQGSFVGSSGAVYPVGAKFYENLLKNSRFAPFVRLEKKKKSNFLID